MRCTVFSLADLHRYKEGNWRYNFGLDFDFGTEQIGGRFWRRKFRTLEGSFGAKSNFGRKTRGFFAGRRRSWFHRSAGKGLHHCMQGNFSFIGWRS